MNATTATRNFLQEQRIGWSAPRPDSKQRHILQVPRVRVHEGVAGRVTGPVLAQHIFGSSGAVDVLIACK